MIFINNLQLVFNEVNTRIQDSNENKTKLEIYCVLVISCIPRKG